MIKYEHARTETCLLIPSTMSWFSIKERFSKTQIIFNIQYLFQYIQLQVQLAEHDVPSPKRKLQVRWLQVLNVFVHVAHQERCDIRLQHLLSVVNTSQTLNNTIIQCQFMMCISYNMVLKPMVKRRHL